MGGRGYSKNYRLTLSAHNTQMPFLLQVKIGLKNE